MIWICSLVLLFLAGWFFLNALNERRWVQAHSHDETVASDPGILPSFSALTGSGLPDTKGKVSISEENSRFARAVAKVQEKTSPLGDKYIETRLAAARQGEDVDGGFFGRAVAKVSEQTSRMDAKLDEKMKAASERSEYTDAGESDEGLFARASRKVAATSEEISQKVANRAKNKNQTGASNLGGSDDDGFFGKMVGKVSSSLDRYEARADSKTAKNRDNSVQGEDLMSRVASKVGNKINELDDKMTRKSGSKSGGSDDKTQG